MMTNGDLNVKIEDEKLKKMRNYIYLLETANLHKRTPKKDTQMVEEIMKYVKSEVAKEKNV